MTSKPQQPQRLPSGFYLKLHFWYQWLFSSFRVSRLFDLSDLGFLEKSWGNIFNNCIFEIGKFHWSKCTVECAIYSIMILKSTQARCACKSSLNFISKSRKTKPAFGRKQNNKRWSVNKIVYMKTSESKAGATSEAVFNTSWKNLNHLYRIEQKRLTELISFLLRWEKIKIMVLCYQNCSDLLWEKIILVIEIEITRTIYSNSEKTEQFLVTECFFNLFLEISKIQEN